MQHIFLHTSSNCISKLRGYYIIKMLNTSYLCAKNYWTFLRETEGFNKFKNSRILFHNNQQVYFKIYKEIQKRQNNQK